MYARTLGRSNIEVSALGLGCWAIGGPTQYEDHHFGWGEVDDAESIRAIQTALDAGVTYFDTADLYGAGHSERILGQALAGRRDRVVIATKFGVTFDEASRRMLGEDASPQYLQRACEASLRRLQTDYIDRYQFHLGDYDPALSDPIAEMLDRLVAAGKIRFYCWSADTPAQALAFAPRAGCTAVQFRLNLFADEPELLEICDQHNLAAIINSPLGRGLLTGKWNATTQFPANDVRHRWNLQEGARAEQLQRLERLRDILISDGRTLAQAALGWIWARNERTIPIPGFKTVQQVAENVAALRYGPLSVEQMQAIAALLAEA